MKLKDILNEIERADMPQVKGKDIPDMLKVLDDNGIAYRKCSIAVGNIKPTQEDGVRSKIDSIASDLQSGKTFPPIVVSQDGWILDGHHRWLAQKKVNGDNYKIETIVIMLPKENAFKLFNVIADKVK